MKILQISTHATLRPRYGGPLRSNQIARCLEHAGFEVDRIAVCWLLDEVPDRRDRCIPIAGSPFWSSSDGREASTWIASWRTTDTARAIEDARELLNQLVSLIANASPDVLLLQHPWTWPLIKNFPGVQADSIRVIYSSHNVEAALKRRMIEDAAVSAPPEVLMGVETLERDLVASAWATVACTDADAKVYQSWGASRVAVANNGAAIKDRDNLVGVLPWPLTTDHSFALFIGSDYLPNSSGFIKYVAPALPRLKPNKRVVVAGSVSDRIKAELGRPLLQHYEDGRLVCLGFVDDLALDALIANAGALLLPIEYGGGSHLKTAEALASGRPIIGTTASFRGFSEYTGLPRVTIANTATDFETAIHDSLAAPGRRLSDLASPREIAWEKTLDPLLQMVRSMAAEPVPANRVHYV